MQYNIFFLIACNPKYIQWHHQQVWPPPTIPLPHAQSIWRLNQLYPSVLYWQERMFALFDFFEEKSVDVGDLNCIDASCGVSLDELYPDQWDFSRDIIVKWPTKSNKKGKCTTSNKLYPARILEISGKPRAPLFVHWIRLYQDIQCLKCLGWNIIHLPELVDPETSMRSSPWTMKINVSKQTGDLCAWLVYMTYSTTCITVWL